MIKEQGLVVKAEQGFIWVETQVTSTCQTCNAKANCGTSTIASAMTSKTVINRAENQLGACVGDRVEIGIPEQSLVSGAFWVYILPLLVAILFASLGQLWLPMFIDVAEWAVILLAFAGGFVGFKIAKWRIATYDSEVLEPKLLKLLPESIEVKEIS